MNQKFIHILGSDSKDRTLFPACHGEHLKGACLHAGVMMQSLCRQYVSARRRGNLMGNARLLPCLPAGRVSLAMTIS
jgi:hypothetical protein